MTRPYLSLCMIVKDGEKTLPALLRSIDGLFDEIVIVDTGSTDKTRDVVWEVFGDEWEEPTDHGDAKYSWLNRDGLPAPEPGKGFVACETRRSETHPVRVVLAHFGWCNDFSAARQYSFELATGTWRMYLDADDTLEYRGESLTDAAVKNGKRPRLKETIQGLVERNPNVDAISFKYLYLEGDTSQNVVRCVRWFSDNKGGWVQTIRRAHGGVPPKSETPDEALVSRNLPLGPVETPWRWEDPVHESLMPGNTPPGGKPRRNVAGISDLVVVHHKPHEEVLVSFARNHAIVEKWLLTPDLDPMKKLKAIYHLAGDAFNHGFDDKADALYAEAATVGSHTSYYTLAMNERVRCAVMAGNLGRALAVATEHAQTHPSDRDGFLRMGWVYALLGRWDDAALMFEDASRRVDKSALFQSDDEWLTKGLVLAYWAQALLNRPEPDVANAEKMLNNIPSATRTHPLVRPVSQAAARTLMRTVGFTRFTAMVDYYIWDTEPLKALALLKNPPAAFAATYQPGIQQRIRELESRLKHLKGWDEYQQAYASIPADTYHTLEEHHADVLGLLRGQMTLEWVKALAPSGPDVECLAIGFQDGDLEDAMLALNDRLVITVCDVAPQSNKGLRVLTEKWGTSRVKHHVLKRDHYDWYADPQRFDLVTMFEVLEHVPDDAKALFELRRALKEKGTLLISTPIADAWVEAYLTDPKSAPEWYGHVRAHNHVSLARSIEDAGLDGDLIAGWDGTFVAKLRRTARPDVVRGVRPRVTILVPSTPTPFDADTLYQKHLGGSEEAVVHLAEAMAAKGVDVTVFAPTPERVDGNTLRYRDGVLWRPVEEFDPLDPDHKRVMFWRCPQVLLNEWAKNLPYKAYHWLHDAGYNTGGPEAYIRALDSGGGVLVLSEHHKRTLKKFDGFDGDVDVLSNGIVAAGFPEFGGDTQRDPHKVIYASSPDRGLEHLLAMWPKIRASVPDATLDIFYDWTLLKQMQSEKYAEYTAAVVRAQSVEIVDEDGIPNTPPDFKIADDLNGVVFHGGVSQPALHDAYRRSSVWAYPHYENTDIETYCISAKKALACGCVPVTSSEGALPEVLGGHGVMTSLEDFASTLITMLKVSHPAEEREKMREYALEVSWDKVALRFMAAMGIGT